MDDIASKISELLSDPGGIDRIKQMAGALFSGGEEENSEPQPNDTPSPDLLSGLLGSLSNSGGPSLPDGFDPMKLMGLMSVLGRSGDDKRTALLLALKPHLSKERQPRVDKAVKFLKIAALMPTLKEQGLLDIF
ncbi:MAG: hypothetical protein E7525_01185 [Ruminococcaceae bacterium]|nr:hypothetical protein [Oscillospiraceae bacterium]